MLRISPKLIDVEGNRVGDELVGDTCIRKEFEGIDNIYGGGKGHGGKQGPIKTGRFPTQLFTNIEHEQFKYCKKINEKI